MKKLLVVLAIVATSCSGDGWTDAQKDQWMDECLNSAGSCACMIDYFEDNGHSFADVAGENGFSIGFEAGQECGL